MFNKRMFFLYIIFIVFMPLRALAASGFDGALAGEIEEYGVFDGKKGVVYASSEKFENTDTLLVAEADEKTLIIKLFNSADGIQCVDMLTIPTGGNNEYAVYSVHDRSASYIRLDTIKNKSAATEFFSVENDALTRVQADKKLPAAPVMTSKDGAVSTEHTSRELYNFLNSLKEDRTADYTMNDDINVISDGLKHNMKLLLSACADISHFDIKDYDYDVLMKYVLNTCENFRILTDLRPGRSENDDIALVKSNYIDYILTNYFRLTPEHPDANSLLSRGFCFDGGYYYYKTAFNSYFSTELSELSHIYNAGSGVYFVIFKDIYRRKDEIIPEYSFAVIQTNGNDCSLLRIGMNELFPDQRSILAYAPQMTAAPLAVTDESIFLRLGSALILFGITALLSVLAMLRRKISVN